jgi:hypothetical protein
MDASFLTQDALPNLQKVSVKPQRFKELEIL